MYQLHDTFNHTIVSSHRTVLAAVKAKQAHGRAIRRMNGDSSYIPIKIWDTETRAAVPDDEVEEAEAKL